MTVRQKV